MEKIQKKLRLVSQLFLYHLSGNVVRTKVDKLKGVASKNLFAFFVGNNNICIDQAAFSLED